MLGREDFDLWLDMLIPARGWQKMSDQSRDVFLDQLNKYKPSAQEFGDYCAKILDAERCQPNDIIKHFKQQHVENARQKLLSPVQVNSDRQSDEFIRFQRFCRELRHALSQGESYPSEKLEFKQVWRRELTDEDRQYSDQRIQVMGVNIPVGGEHAG